MEKKLESLGQGDYKRIVIPTNINALAFEDNMRLMAKILTALWFARKDVEQEEKKSENFDEFASKFMADQDDQFREECVEHSLLFCSPETIDMSAVEQSVQKMLAVNKDIGPGELFTFDRVGFKRDLFASQVRKVLQSVIEKQSTTDTLRTLCIKLMCQMGLTRANPEDLLRCAIYQAKYKIELTDEAVRYFCD